MLRSMTLLLFMAAAAIKDKQTCRIPNLLLAAGAVNGCILRFVGQSWEGIADAAAGAFLPLLLCGGLFILSMLGAGDIKLLMTIGIYLGPEQIWRVLIDSFVIGAGLSLVLLTDFGLAAERGAYFMTYVCKAAKGERRPYIDMDNPPHDKRWSIHFSLPILLAVLFEQMPGWIHYCEGVIG